MSTPKKARPVVTKKQPVQPASPRGPLGDNKPEAKPAKPAAPVCRLWECRCGSNPDNRRKVEAVTIGEAAREFAAFTYPGGSGVEAGTPMPCGKAWEVSLKFHDGSRLAVIVEEVK